MKNKSLLSLFLALSISILETPSLGLPVDLSIPPSVLGPTSEQGFATHWVEMGELDFGGGLTLPVRLGFLSGRTAVSPNFGSMPWRAPLLSSRIYERNAGYWKVLLPCGRVMTLFPSAEKPGQWATSDGEWLVTPKDRHTLVSRLDGWEMEFDHQDFLIRLRTDTARQVVWNRDRDGNVLTLTEQPQDPKMPATLGFTARRDPVSKLYSSLTYRTAHGQKTYTLGYDGEKRLLSVGFPDTTAHQISYSTTVEGHPSMKIVGRDLIPTSLTWHKENRTLLSDGVWSYTITPQRGNSPLMSRTGPYGEVESQHDDSINARELFISAEGTQTIKQKVKTGPAKGKIEKITRILSAGEAQDPNHKSEIVNHKSEQILYTATYNAQGLVASETDALGRTTTHRYTLHGSTIHTGIKTHTAIKATEPKPAESVDEFDRHGNLIATTNPLGQTTRHEYDSQNRRIKTIGPDGTVLETLTYTAQGRIATRTDAAGASTRFSYDKDGNRITTSNALGHITIDAFDARGQRIQSTDPLGRVTAFEYDQGGRLIQQTVAHGTPIAATTLYTYDEQGRRLSTTDPAGHTTTQTYDKLGRLTSRTDPLGHTTRFEYDVKRGSTGCISCSASGLPTRIISPSGRITERLYNADRHLIQETIGLQEIQNTASSVGQAAITRHTYDLAGNLLTTTDPLGRTTSHEYNALNKRIRTAFPDGSTRVFVYNVLGYLIAETDELGHTTKRDYDAYGNVVALTTPEGHVTRTLFTETTESQEVRTKKSGAAALHRHAAIVTPSGEKTTFTHDVLGRKIAVTKGAESQLAATTTHTFDAVGNEVQSTSPTGKITRHEYDERNRRIRTVDALNRSWRFTYDTDSGASGPVPCCGADPTTNTRAATTLHPDGTKETRVSNAAGQLVATTDAKGDTVQYEYDADGRLTTLTDEKGSVTTWRYDGSGKLVAKTYADKTTELYEHDLAGQMTRRIRPDGTAATYTYNPRGRLLTIVWSDAKTESSTFAYDAAGRMTFAQNQSATIRRGYHPSGKLKTEIQEIHPGFEKAEMEKLKSEVQYAYTPEGRLSRLTYPDASMVSYEYNIRGELARVIDTGHEGKSVRFDYARRADGKITAIDLPNGAKTTKTYDEVGRLKTIAHLDKGGKILDSETSRYDLRNRRTARIKADGSTDLFRYDPAGQVTAAAYGQANMAPASGEPPPPGVDANSTTRNDEPGSSSFTPSQTFAYDAAGNRLEVTDNGMTTKYQPNAANQYEQIVTGTEIVEPEFDPLGNLLQDDRNTYTWDSDIHLLSVSTMSKGRPGTKNQEQRTEFRYDPLHRRVARLENQSELTFFTHDGWNVIQEHSGNVKLETSNLKRGARHTWGEDLSGTLQGAGGVGGLLGTIHNVSKTKTQEQEIAGWFHYDSNGNVILLTDFAGDASARYAYDAFGQTLTGTGIAADLNRYRFSTKPIESGSGLAYYGYRYYDPRSGRWPSRDPIMEAGGINVYAMLKNNSLANFDAFGLYSCAQCDDERNTCINVCDETLDHAQDEYEEWLDERLVSVSENHADMREFIDDYSNDGLIGSLLENLAQGVNSFGHGDAEIAFRISYGVALGGSAIAHAACVAGCNWTHDSCRQGCTPTTCSNP